MGRGHTEFHPISEGTWLQRLRALGWDGSTPERGAITVHGFRALFATTAYTRYIVTRAEEHALEFQQDHKLTEGVRAHYTRDRDGSHRGLLWPNARACCNGGPMRSTWCSRLETRRSYPPRALTWRRHSPRRKSIATPRN